MQRRLLASTLAVVAAAVLTLAAPLAVLGVHQVHTSFRDRLRAQAGAVAIAVGEQLEDHEPVDPDRLARLVPDRQVHASVGGRTYTAGPHPVGATTSASASAEHGVTVTVSSSDHDEHERALMVLGVVTLLVAASAVVAVVAALLLAAQLTRPLTALVRAADQLGAGNFDLDPRPLGLPEADRVAAVLAHSGRRIGELVDRQRQFARDAAHQLRTPLTAIGLRLEGIASADVPAETRRDAESALAQVDRLATVVTVLLARARGDAARPRPVDLADLFDELARHWGPLADRAGRTLVIESAPLVGLANRDHLAQALSVLLENSLRHGAGTIRLTVVAQDEDALISLSDEGPGIPADRVATLFTRTPGGEGNGIGLFLARALVEADGGEIRMATAQPPLFTVTIPALAPDGAPAVTTP
ncbi:ATP-binding protein [Frankia sp. R82]|uniref:ATP-binding protein n=1 Tax=Frankia sp. R82 TaxID=2950553 RepID=UPI0020434CDB|nr:ATP-binding protein [Frankia sp. R82]MCM3882359.1 ATP-binding protein [Frankia sp. R82]